VVKNKPTEEVTELLLQIDNATREEHEGQFWDFCREQGRLVDKAIEETEMRRRPLSSNVFVADTRNWLQEHERYTIDDLIESRWQLQ
jgi:hypothetical protein